MPLASASSCVSKPYITCVQSTFQSAVDFPYSLRDSSLFLVDLLVAAPSNILLLRFYFALLPKTQTLLFFQALGKVFSDQ